jgi:ubiquinol-cytochrome c reductase cytochrome c1 subunit
MFSKLFTSTARRATFATSALGAVAYTQLNNNQAMCSDDHIPALDYGWSHHGALASFDYASIRRGFQVYKQVCSSCHSINLIAFRNLVGVTHDENSVKKIAETYDIPDGPDDSGQMFERPGKLSDKIPGPYANEEEARGANGGALPPDLSLMVKSRHDGIDYIVALLNGYVEAPAGKPMLPGLHYNPYFPGGAIAMQAPLTDGQVEYEDGTPSTVSQMSKDVACFLAWAAEPEHDDRKKNGAMFLTCLALAIGFSAYYKRMRWSPIKSRKITYTK